MAWWLALLAHLVNTPFAWWLRRQGWVVFYLKPQARRCGTSFNGQMPACWLALYEQSQKPQPKFRPDAFAMTMAPLVDNAANEQRAADCMALGRPDQADAYRRAEMHRRLDAQRRPPKPRSEWEFGD